MTRRRQRFPFFPFFNCLPALMLFIAAAVLSAADAEPAPMPTVLTPVPAPDFNPRFNPVPGEDDVGPGRDYAITVIPGAGVWTSTLQRISIDLGVTWLPLRGAHQQFGMSFTGEIGTGGGKFKFGPAVGDLREVFRRASLSAAFFWTQWKPVALERKQTYAGVELDLVPAYYGMRFQVGIYKHINGYDDRHDWIVNAAFGFGF